MNVLKGFRDFLMRGNVVDLAVAVIIGGAFGAIVKSLVEDIITPLIAAVVGKPSFGGLAITLNGSPIKYGNFLNATINFLLVGGAVYFLIVAPISKVNSKLKKDEPAAELTTKICGECQSAIPIAAKRCAFCTQPVD
jgi:large conductance mechanosensitive channel